MSEHNDDDTHESHDDPLAELEGWLDEQLEGSDPLPSPDEAELGELARDPSPDGTCPSCGTTLEPRRTKPGRKGAEWVCPKGCDQ